MKTLPHLPLQREGAKEESLFGLNPSQKEKCQIGCFPTFPYLLNLPPSLKRGDTWGR